MSAELRVLVVGSGELAESVATEIHRSSQYQPAGLVAAGQPLEASADLVISLAPPAQRVAVAQTAIAAGKTVATLPFASDGETERQLATSGKLTQVSGLLGYAALVTLRDQVRRGALGRRYSLFAAHRVRQGTPELFETLGVDLLRYALSVIGEVPVKVQTTQASLFGSAPDTWLTLLHLADGTVATIEMAASLASSAPEEAQILAEANGSEAVLRAEPTRQAVRVSARDGSTQERGWWRDLAFGFTTAATAATKQPDPTQELGWLRLVSAVRRAGEAGTPVEVEGL